MFLLDTNVVSELRKARSGKANSNVANWAVAHAQTLLFVSVITVLELERGILLLERRDEAQGGVLRRWLQGSVLPAFAGRILPVDVGVARRCARLHVPDTRPERDSLIAATALVHALAVVTRNVAHFRIDGLVVIDPWEHVGAV